MMQSWIKVYSKNAVKVRIIQLWFSKFRFEDFSLTDKHDDDIHNQNVKTIMIKIGVNR